MNHAEEIKSIRTEMGLTQSEFGALLGKSGTAVCRWEDGRQLSMTTVLAARHVLAEFRSRPTAA